MIRRLSRLWRAPLSRKLQYLGFRRARVAMSCWHRWRLRSCGSNCIVQRPLFWTPECIALGDDVLVWAGCRIEGVEAAGVPPGIRPLIEFGRGVTMQQNCHITAAGHLRIDAGTTVLFDVVITDIDHGYEQLGVRVIDQPVRFAQTHIGRNSFICSGAKILAGTVLGEHCIVGANAVVRGSFPAGSVIAGDPGRVVKRYDPASAAWLRVGAPAHEAKGSPHFEPPGLKA